MDGECVGQHWSSIFHLLKIRFDKMCWHREKKVLEWSPDPRPRHSSYSAQPKENDPSGKVIFARGKRLHVFYRNVFFDIANPSVPSYLAKYRK